MMRWLFFIPLACLFVACGNDSTTVSSADEAEVRAVVDAYTNALEQQDAQAVAEFWVEGSVYRNPISGELVQGRDQMVEQFKLIFTKIKDADLIIKVSDISFPLADKAVEKGVARLTWPGEEPIESEYQMILLKKDGRWHIQHVSKIDLGVLEHASQEAEE